jgi:hypothetical protein
MAQNLAKDAFWKSLFRTFVRFGKFKIQNWVQAREILHAHALLG